MWGNPASSVRPMSSLAAGLVTRTYSATGTEVISATFSSSMHALIGPVGRLTVMKHPIGLFRSGATSVRRTSGVNFRISAITPKGIHRFDRRLQLRCKTSGG